MLYLERFETYSRILGDKFVLWFRNARSNEVFVSSFLLERDNLEISRHSKATGHNRGKVRKSKLEKTAHLRRIEVLLSISTTWQTSLSLCPQALLCRIYRVSKLCLLQNLNSKQLVEDIWDFRLEFHAHKNSVCGDGFYIIFDSLKPSQEHKEEEQHDTILGLLNTHRFALSFDSDTFHFMSKRFKIQSFRND